MLNVVNVPVALLLHPHDNVWIVCRDVAKGEVVTVGECSVISREDIAVGHKIAFKDLDVGIKVLRYGAPIGSLTNRVAKGEHVHTHNLKSDYLPSHGRGGVNLDGVKND